MFAAPSTRPRYAGPAPSVSIRKTGRSGKTISVPMSVKRLVRPRRTTVAGRRGRVCARHAHADYSGAPTRAMGRPCPSPSSSATARPRPSRRAPTTTSSRRRASSNPRSSESGSRRSGCRSTRCSSGLASATRRPTRPWSACSRRTGLALPEATLVPELDEHDGLSLVFKTLPPLAADDPALRAIVEATARGRAAVARRRARRLQARHAPLGHGRDRARGGRVVDRRSARASRARWSASRRSGAARRRSSSPRRAPWPRRWPRRWACATSSASST